MAKKKAINASKPNPKPSGGAGFLNIKAQKAVRKLKRHDPILHSTDGKIRVVSHMYKRVEGQTGLLKVAGVSAMTWSGASFADAKDTYEEELKQKNVIVEQVEDSVGEVVVSKTGSPEKVAAVETIAKEPEVKP